MNIVGKFTVLGQTQNGKNVYVDLYDLELKKLVQVSSAQAVAEDVLNKPLDLVLSGVQFLKGTSKKGTPYAFLSAATISGKPIKS